MMQWRGLRERGRRWMMGMGMGMGMGRMEAEKGREGEVMGGRTVEVEAVTNVGVVG